MPTTWPPGFRAMDLDPSRNNVGITAVADIASGRLNVWRNSAPAAELPAGEVVTVDAVPFAFPRVDRDRPDNVRCDGQLVAVVPGRYDWLYVLAAAERRVEDEVAVHFADGSVDFEPLRISDFWAASAAFGETLAFATSAMHYPGHVQPGVSAMLWCQRVSITRRAELTAVRWPRNIAVHVFAATLCPAPEVGR